MAKQQKLPKMSHAERGEFVFDWSHLNGEAFEAKYPAYRGAWSIAEKQANRFRGPRASVGDIFCEMIKQTWD